MYIQSVPTKYLVLSHSQGCLCNHECSDCVFGSHEIPTAVDKTRIRHNEYLRNEEVLFWIEQHPYVTHWIAIDDLPMPQLGEHYIQTSPDTGLTDANVQRSIQVLTDPKYDRSP